MSKMDKEFSDKISLQLAGLLAPIMFEAQNDKGKMVAVMERLTHNLTMTMTMASNGDPKVYDELALRIGEIIEKSGKHQIDIMKQLTEVQRARERKT